MKKPFIYGMSVDGDNFTDRELETLRLKLFAYRPAVRDMVLATDDVVITGDWRLRDFLRDINASF